MCSLHVIDTGICIIDRLDLLKNIFLELFRLYSYLCGYHKVWIINENKVFKSKLITFILMNPNLYVVVRPIQLYKLTYYHSLIKNRRICWLLIILFVFCQLFTFLVNKTPHY